MANLNKQLIQEEAKVEVAKRLFRFSVLKLKNLVKTKKITSADAIKKANIIKNNLIAKYGTQIQSTLMDPTLPTTFHTLARIAT